MTQSVTSPQDRRVRRRYGLPRKRLPLGSRTRSNISTHVARTRLVTPKPVFPPPVSLYPRYTPQNKNKNVNDTQPGTKTTTSRALDHPFYDLGSETVSDRDTGTVREEGLGMTEVDTLVPATL